MHATPGNAPGAPVAASDLADVEPDPIRATGRAPVVEEPALARPEDSTPLITPLWSRMGRTRVENLLGAELEPLVRIDEPTRIVQDGRVLHIVPSELPPASSDRVEPEVLRVADFEHEGQVGELTLWFSSGLLHKARFRPRHGYEYVCALGELSRRLLREEFVDLEPHTRVSMETSSHKVPLMPNLLHSPDFVRHDVAVTWSDERLAPARGAGRRGARRRTR